MDNIVVNLKVNVKEAAGLEVSSPKYDTICLEMLLVGCISLEHYFS